MKCGNCGKDEQDIYAGNVRVVGVDGKKRDLRFCLVCTDYVLDTEEGEDLVLQSTGETVQLDESFYRQNEDEEEV